METQEKTPEELALDNEAQMESLASTSSDWIVGWILRKKGNFEMAKNAMKARFKEIMKQIDNQERSLEKSSYYETFELEAEKKLQENKGKSKSIKMIEGTIGHRTVKDKIEITDHQKAYQFYERNANSFGKVYLTDMIKSIDQQSALEYIWALEECIDAGGDHEPENYGCARVVKEVKTKPFLDYFLSTGEVPDGCELIEGGEKFFAKPTVLKLESNG